MLPALKILISAAILKLTVFVSLKVWKAFRSFRLLFSDMAHFCGHCAILANPNVPPAILAHSAPGLLVNDFSVNEASPFAVLIGDFALVLHDSIQCVALPFEAVEVLLREHELFPVALGVNLPNLLVLIGVADTYLAHHAFLLPQIAEYEQRMPIVTIYLTLGCK